MKIYESTGTFNDVNKEFNLAVQLTNIAPDTFKITAYYDISTSTRYAIVAILQTNNENKNDLSNYPANFTFSVNNVKFSTLNKNYKKVTDKDINNIIKGETITVIVHHGIGFNPTTNTDDDLYIKNYKAGTYTYYAKGSPPGTRGSGVLA
jgi:hypothetical protein